MPLPLRAEQVYLREEERAIFQTAIGIARLRFRDGDLQGASDALDDACDEAHVRHFDACIEDGYAVEAVERFLGLRDRKVERVRRLTADERKIAAYDAARATVKTEGQTRAFYVLRAEAAEAEVVRLREALERIYQQGRGPHVALARAALDAE